MENNIREIVFDTETTGFNYSTDDRVIEIGCVEMLNHIPTGKTYHCYINPERDVPDAVVKVHGITTEFLSDKPKFIEIVDDFLEFIGTDSFLVAHNAMFDMNFLNSELKRIGYSELSFDRMIDTLALSKKKNPHFSRHSLDALCVKYGIDNSHRDLHGALLDARLLAEVYIELLGGKEVDFFKAKDETDTSINEVKNDFIIEKIERTFHTPRKFLATDEEIQLHTEHCKSFKKTSIWFLENEPESK